MTKDLKLWLQFIESNDKVAKKLLEKKLKYTADQKGLEEFLKEDFVAMARKYGYDINKRDIKLYVKRTLSGAELESVAGRFGKKEAIGIGLTSLILLSSLSITNFFFNKDQKVNHDVEISQSTRAEDNSAKNIESEKSESKSEQKKIIRDSGNFNTEDSSRDVNEYQDRSKDAVSSITAPSSHKALSETNMDLLHKDLLSKSNAEPTKLLSEEREKLRLVDKENDDLRKVQAKTKTKTKLETANHDAERLQVGLVKQAKNSEQRLSGFEVKKSLGSDEMVGDSPVDGVSMPVVQSTGAVGRYQTRALFQKDMYKIKKRLRDVLEENGLTYDDFIDAINGFAVLVNDVFEQANEPTHEKTTVNVIVLDKTDPQFLLLCNLDKVVQILDQPSSGSDRLVFNDLKKYLETENPDKNFLTRIFNYEVMRELSKGGFDEERVSSFAEKLAQYRTFVDILYACVSKKSSKDLRLSMISKTYGSEEEQIKENKKKVINQIEAKRKLYLAIKAANAKGLSQDLSADVWKAYKEMTPKDQLDFLTEIQAYRDKNPGAELNEEAVKLIRRAADEHGNISN